MSETKIVYRNPMPFRKRFFRFYRSPFGMLLYSTRFCRWDWLGILIVFGLTFFYSMLAGYKATDHGYIGDWYAFFFAPTAVSIYSTGELGVPEIVDPRVDGFLNRGSRGEHEYFTLSDEVAKSPAFSKDYVSQVGSTGICYLLALWWKLIGYPDWSTVFILFGIWYGLTIVAAYFALRQVTGLVPSVLLALLLGAYPSMMYQTFFWFRDGARTIFCYMALAILLYQLKRCFNWKGTIVCGFFLFVICSLFNMFRNDFIVLVPFIAIAAVFFHGKLHHGFRKKAVIVLSIVLGLVSAAWILPKEKTIYGFGHVLYVGLANQPYMEKLYFNSDNYSNAISYSDLFGFIAASSKNYYDNTDLNPLPYSEDYDQVIKGMICSLVRLFPYDFLRLAWSSCFQSVRTGSGYAERQLNEVNSAPGAWLFQKSSANIYSHVPCWFYFVLFCLTALLFLGGRFYASILLSFALMCMSGCYLFQFDIRHYYYLMFIPLLSFGFVFNRAVRLFSLLLEKRERLWKVCLFKKKVFLIHCVVAAGLFGLSTGVLQGAKLFQEKQVSREMENFHSAKKEELKFWYMDTTSMVLAGFPATRVVLPGFCRDVFARERPDQADFVEFLKVTFRVVSDYKKEQIYVCSMYENTREWRGKYSLYYYSNIVCNSTKTCPIPLSFSARKGTNTLYFPVFMSRDSSPLTGFEIVAGGNKIVIDSVERVAERDAIHTQSAFLVPEDSSKIRYCGRVHWDHVLWEKPQ